ncbi:MAG: selenium-dependent xanthine dehydrogenase [Pseudomonadota bacterium]
MRFRLNSKEINYSGDPELSLFDYLRDIAGLTSVRKGCAGEGACGYCSVELENKTTLSCHTLMKDVEGAKVVTIEGWEPRIQDAFADAFVEKGAVQCGFCTPGIVIQAKAMLDKNPTPTREQVVQNLNKSLCRCTGYHKIVDAILLAAEAIRENKKVPRKTLSAGVGKRYSKYNARDLVLGRHIFVGDMKRDGMLHGALKFSDHPRAQVVSIDTSKAKKIPGVQGIFTAKEIPGDRRMGTITPDWPLMIREGEETRYIGDVLACVAADSVSIARKAVDAIEIKYEVLTPVTDPFEALKPQAPKIHKNGNILSVSMVKRGNVEKTLAESAYRSEGRFTTQRVEHAFAEPEACFVEPSKEGLKVFSQGQGAYEDRTQIAKLLKLPESNVNVIQVETGGGFGGKEDLTVQGHAALASWLTKKPVGIILDRTESIRMHPKRHPFVMDYKVGCDKNGKLTALYARMVADGGAYASVGAKVVERAVGHAAGAYIVPNVDVEGLEVYTNNIPCGAMRGFGVPQSTFAIESLIDELCEKGGFDRWQFRYDNAVRDGEMITTGQIIRGGAGVRQTLLALKDVFRKAKHAGIACGIKNTGIGNGMWDTGRCKIEIVSEKKVILHHGWTEMGQGIHTMGVQALCEETGIDPSIVEVRVDTSAEAVCGMTTASRGTSLLAHSVINACKELKADLKKKSLKELSGKLYAGEWNCDWTTKPDHPNEKGEHHTHYSYGYATQVVVLDENGKIDTVYAAHDAGRIMNPTLFEGQIEGSIHMGLGYALTEELPMKDGHLVFDKLAKCGVLRAKQMPKVVVKGVEVADPNGPFGAKGVGEIGLVPTPAAVANALYQYDKKRRYTLPIKDKKVL